MERTRGESPRPVSGGTWTIGLASWAALLGGMPISSLAFIGILGLALDLAALCLAVVFVVLVLRHTRGSDSRVRALGLVALLAGIGLAGWSAAKPTDVFGYEYKRQAIERYRIAGPDSPTVDQRLTVWREAHPWWEGGLLWLGAAILFPVGLRLLGSRSVPWLIVSALAAGATGPMALAICLRLANAGWVSWN